MSIYQYPLKVDKELIAQIQELAERENRSTNKQIEYMLRQYLLKIQPTIDKAIEDIKDI